MKNLFVALLIMSTATSFAQSHENFQQRYYCYSQNGTDVGLITLLGDPVQQIFSEVTVNGQLKAFRYGVSDRAYLYFYDDFVGQTNSWAAEVLNYPASYSQFGLTIYGKDHLVMGSLAIGRYLCSL